MYLNLSINAYRNKKYAAFLNTCREQKASVENIIALGYSLMRKYKLHHHFFEDYSLWSTSKCLADHVLKNIEDFKPPFLTEAIAKDIIVLFEKRIAQRIPVEYITNEASYLGFTYYVNEHVLVPRSIMNTRFEEFLKLISWENNRVLDLCCGSGCIGLTLALLEPKIKVDLADISPQALEVTQINIDRHGLNTRAHCVESNVFESLNNKYDLIITNPPYVSMSEYQNSADEFKAEPKIALEAGSDGLVIIHKILAQAKQYLNPNGLLIAEIGFSAAKLVKKHYPHIPFQWFKYKKPNGSTSFFSMHGVFLCRACDLP